MRRLSTSLAAVLAVGLVAALAATSAQGQNKNWRQMEKDIQQHNAARMDRGGQISLELLGKDTGLDRNSMPEQATDGNVHSRCVLWNPPYRFRIELVDKIPVSEINFIMSDYASEAAPRDLEIRLSDNTVIKYRLEVTRPERNQPLPRQTVKVGKDIKWVEVTVLTQDDGPVNAKTGKGSNYGGIGEIEVITTADLDKYMVVPSWNASAPTYVEGGSPRNDYSGLKVAMPTKIELGTYPGLFLTRDEIVKMREAMKGDPRTTAGYEKVIATCTEWLDKKIEMPDPNVPAQLKDRGDAAAKAHDQLSKMASWFGWAYQLTDDERFAEKGREILVGYAKLYPNDYKEHKGVNGSDTSKVMAQRLSEAMWVIPLIQCYDMIHDAKCMSDADRKLVEDDLIRTCITFINRKQSAEADVADLDKKDPNWRKTEPTGPRKTIGNWTNFYNAAYVQGGIVLRDQNWIDIGMANTRSNIHTGIGDDGMWGEGAIGYHLFGRRAIVACVEPLARKGVDLYGFEACRYKNLFDSPLKYAYPDGTAPGINDSGRASIAGSYEAMDYDYAWLRYQDPNYGRLVNAAPRQFYPSASVYFPTVIYAKLPEAPLKGLGSLVFDNLGYAILRGEDGGDQTYLLMDYGPHGGGHGHPDKLNLIMFADGDELAGEPQGYRYEDRRHREWTRPTIAHWSMAVDENPQMPHTGRLLGFYDSGAVKVMRGCSGEAYPGVGIDRTVVQMPGYVADIYRGWGTTKHTFDYPLCFRGSLDALKGVAADSLKPMGGDAVVGYKHIMAAAPVKTGDNWTGTWTRDAVTVAEGQELDESAANDERRSHPANEVKAIVVGEPDTTVYFGTVPGGRQQAILRRQGTEAVFATVVDPYKRTDVVKSVERIKVEGPVPGYGLKVSRTDGGTDLIIVRFDPQVDGKLAGASTFEGGKTDALVSVVRLDKDGKVVDLGMVGGTELSSGGQTVTSAEPGVKFSK